MSITSESVEQKAEQTDKAPSQHEIRSAETRAQILDAAEKAFSSHGYVGASTRKIAEGCGVSQGLLNHHFGSKRALHQAVKARLAQKLQQFLLEARPIEDLAINQYPESLSAGLRVYFRFLKENPAMARLISWSELEGSQDPWGQEKLMINESLRRLQEAKDKGQIIPEIDVRTINIAAAAMVHYWSTHRDYYQKIMDWQGKSIDEIDEMYLEQILLLLKRGTTPKQEG